jgi:hypothetical protein
LAGHEHDIGVRGAYHGGSGNGGSHGDGGWPERITLDRRLGRGAAEAVAEPSSAHRRCFVVGEEKLAGSAEGRLLRWDGEDVLALFAPALEVALSYGDAAVVQIARGHETFVGRVGGDKGLTGSPGRSVSRTFIGRSHQMEEDPIA